MNNYFQRLFKQLMNNGVRSSVSGLRIANDPLRHHVAEYLSKEMGEPGSLLADPVFEATFPWQAANKTMKELANDGLLELSLVNALDKPPKEYRKEYSFPKTRKPYTHQLESWQILLTEQTKEKAKRSIVVTSGTGSGKTECFLIPILNDLVQEYNNVEKQPLEGVRALFLYPLNALINSQKDRLNAWTDAFGDGVRYCLYNGLTPNRPNRRYEQIPNAIESREQLRNSPPPILVTNATMLEYMLVRTQDKPILEKSEGKLRWIVLDEAHSYLGSQAAELALLLRRVMHAFKVKPENVRFIATSATIGDQSSKQKLKEFLAQMAGVTIDCIEVIGGLRQVPKLPFLNKKPKVTKLKELETIDSGQAVSEKRFISIAEHPELLRLRQWFTDKMLAKPVKKLSEISQFLFNDQATKAEKIARTLRILDLCSVARPLNKDDQDVFLPLRAHIFGRTVGGLWACVNHQCSQKSKQLQHSDWAFGEVYFSKKDHCDCGYPVLDIVSCNECNTIHLEGIRDNNGCIQGLTEADNVDEFARELDIPEDHDEEHIIRTSSEAGDYRILITAKTIGLSRKVYLNKERQIQDISKKNNCIPINYYSDDNEMRCPVCDKKEQAKHSLFMRKILGAPFHLAATLPTLLEFSPTKNDKFAHPWDGRRMITFTDSRQGTARTAAGLQLDAERMFIRSQVYHTLLVDEAGGNSEELVQLKNELTIIRNELNNSGLSNTIRTILKGQEETLCVQIEEAEGHAVISWEQMTSRLATRATAISQWVIENYSRNEEKFKGNNGIERLAEMLLAREFLRRPKKQNNLESMGLVQLFYPALEKNINKVPESATDIGFELSEWQSFLKLILDWHVRANQAVEHEIFWQNWIGIRFPFTKLASPSQKENIKGTASWPIVRNINNLNRIVRLLSHVYALDPSKVKDKDLIYDVMVEAWRALKNTKILIPVGENNFRLDLRNQVSFRLMDKGWICPITRRVLDTTLKGITPFLPQKTKEIQIECEEIEIPVYQNAFSGKELARQWLNSNEQVKRLREKDLWNNLYDRVIENSHYFATAEHSAQQDALVLRKLEKSFKDGNLNILSCSTTMEMGVDIGGISLVAMNNVPPNPANYLQRAGRAGRRSEAQSVSYTLCKDNPHGHQVIANTRWPFDSNIPLPQVSLQSASIVQRHVNSLLLAEFLSDISADENINILRLNCEWFFLAENPEDAPCYKMINWCSYGTQREFLKKPLKRLIKQSVLEGQSSTQLLLTTATMLKFLIDKWQADFNSFAMQINELEKNTQETNKRAVKAIEIGMHRLKMEYLLSELSVRNFLPGYGFPNGVVSLNTITAEQLARERKQKEQEENKGHLLHRDDNNQRFRNFPSRSRSIAVREYAPGAEVVINGLVYRSEGISLSWQKPVSEKQIKELQDFSYSWHCQKCGASGMEKAKQSADHCCYCGTAIKPKDQLKCLQPNGFAVDIGWQVHNDINKPHYLPVQPPRVTANGDWIPLVQEKLGRFRTTLAGTILFVNSGDTAHGYAICLECGRAADMPKDTNKMPEIFNKQSHRRLRGGSIDGSSECSGSFDSWKIQPAIHLVHRDITDVFELQLKNIESDNYLDDACIATTLAIALRHAAAQFLGISDDELGYAVNHVEIAGGRTWSMLIYDTSDGGAGYSSSLGQNIIALLQDMYKGLHCSEDCDSACHHCLLTFDTQYQADLLDRKLALKWLTQSFPDSLSLSEELCLLGKNSVLETSLLFESLDRSIIKLSASKIRLFLGGDLTHWDTSWGELRYRILRWRSQGLSVELIVAQVLLDNLSNELKQHFIFFVKGLGLQVLSPLKSPLIKKGVIVAELVSGKNNIKRWACEDSRLTEAGAKWGKVDSMSLIVSCADNPPLVLEQVDLPDIVTEQDSNDIEIIIADELHGKGSEFGIRFWDKVTKDHTLLKKLIMTESVISIHYSDRYLNSPLVAILLIQVIKELETRCPYIDSQTQFSVKLAEVTTQHYSRENSVWDDWLDNNKREKAISSTLDYLGISANVGVYRKINMPHSRAIEIEFSSGKKATIRLDEGFSYWETVRDYHSRYDFSLSAQLQGEKLANWSGKLARQRRNYATVLFVSVR